MGENVNIESRFLQPFYSAANAMQMAEVPLLIAQNEDHTRLVDQMSAALGGTVLYSSQPDLVNQALASLRGVDYLFIIIDRPLAGKAHDLVRAYLAARDIMGADPSALKEKFGAKPPHADHRLVLAVGRRVFNLQPDPDRRHLAEFCTVIAVP
jgi:hypothetical protein